MAEAAMIQEEVNVPEGGIADFIMEDADAEAVYGTDEEVPSGGIGQFEEVAKEMAAAGREGDDVIAHLETGELIIPKAFLDQNPEMKETIFAFLESQGVEDPQRYVVGTDANSINPETGVPEFFGFIKKAFKKVVSGVKKVVKKVVKVVKKIAPVVLPIVGTMMFGPIYGAAMGSGIATLINGGNVKDALKSALVSGVTGGISAGVSGMMTPGVGFTQGIANAASFNNIRAGFGSIGNAFKGDFSGISAKNMAQGPASEGGTAFEQYQPTGTSVAANQLSGTTEQVTTGLSGDPALTGANEVELIKVADTTLPDSGTFGSNIKDAFTPGGKTFGESMKDAFLPKGPTASDFLAKEGLTPISASAEQLAGAKLMASEAAPSLIAKYAPIAGATALAAGAAGAFKVPEQEDPGLVQRNEDGSVTTGTDLIEQDPSGYLIGDIGTRRLNPNTGQYEDVASAINNSPYTIPTNYRFNNPYTSGTLVSGPFARPQMMAADGGEVYPRRNGGIMPNEGIPNQDSVRAMLMPGEFVMTTDAVKGLGNGSMNQGIKNMYSVMRGLENRGRATA